MSGGIKDPLRLFIMFLKSAAFYLFKTPTHPKDRFDLLYSIKKDPWHYNKSPYELKKYQETLSLIKEEAAIKEKEKTYNKVLEIGCSIGVFTAMLAPHCSHLLAVDASEVAIARAKEHCKSFPQIEFRCMDIFKAEPGTGFDLIVCSEILYYLDDTALIKELMYKMHNWLTLPGKLLLTHMRRKSEDGIGFGRSFFNFPRMGAVTVHNIFKENNSFKLINEIERELYLVSLFEKKL